jgi:Pyruvate/2-oxoacid:ferredoxin oxidoreductase delta subunit
MTDEIYRELREHLNTHPVGFPASESGAEIELLKRIFTPEQAAIVCRLDWHHKTADKIFPGVSDLVSSPEQLTNVLNGIVRSGGLYHRRTESKETWALAPFVVGMWEMNVDRIDPEFKTIHDDYRHSPKIDPPVRREQARQMRVIPIRESVAVERRVAQYDEITELVEKAGDSIGVMECICRKYKRMDGHTCEYTDRHESCTTFLSFAEQLIEEGVARRATRDEALAMFADFRSRGMALMPAATREPTFVCSCCKDCCKALNGLRMSERPADNAMSNYYSVVSAENCTGCRECEKYCPMDAITVQSGIAVVYEARCIGCGVCVSRCESEAIGLTPKDTQVTLPRDMDDMWERFHALRG